MSEEKRPEWMTSISANVNPDEYLSGRKIDKTFELAQEEKAKKAKEIREELIASNKLKLANDPILELERRKQQLKLELMSNPLKLRKFREYLLKEERERRGESSQAKLQQDDSSAKESKNTRTSMKDHLSDRRSRHRSPSSSSSSTSCSTTSSSAVSSSPTYSRSHRSRRNRSKERSKHRDHRRNSRDRYDRRRHVRDERKTHRSRRKSKSYHRDRSRSREKYRGTRSPVGKRTSYHGDRHR